MRWSCVAGSCSRPAPPRCSATTTSTRAMCWLTMAAEGWRVTGFVEVENAVAADPLLDLAKTEYYSVRRDDTKLDVLLAGYGFAPENLRERLTMYRVYHALELWDWFASI